MKIRKYRILNAFGSEFTKQAENVLLELGQVEKIENEQKLLEQRIVDCHVLVVPLGVNIDKQKIDKAKDLKIIATPTTGLDHIDVEYAKNKGIEVLSLKGETMFLETITGTAELAFGLLLDMARKTHSVFESVKNYEWNREKFRGNNLSGKTLGIIGLGRLGKLMAKYGNAFDMQIIACDPYVDECIFNELKCRETDFDELLGESDIISIHIHLNKETENLFCKDVFNKMKNTAFLINTSRGKIVNEADLLEALKNKKIAGYATDVLADELDFNKNFSKHLLVEYAKNHDNLIITPHIGGMTHESRERTDLFIVEKLKNFLLNSDYAHK